MYFDRDLDSSAEIGRLDQFAVEYSVSAPVTGYWHRAEVVGARVVQLTLSRVYRNPDRSLFDWTTYASPGLGETVWVSYRPHPHDLRARIRSVGEGNLGPRTAPGFERVEAEYVGVDPKLSVSDAQGGSAFALTLRFSEEFPLSFRTLRDSALSVMNGTLTGVARTTAGENREWTLEVTPDGDTAVTVTLAAPADLTVSVGPAASCSATGAVCAADEDYTAAAGTLSFSPGQTTQTVPVAVLDDPHDEGSETFTLALSNPSGNHAWLSAARATGTISNSDPLPKGWLARFGRTSATQVLGLLDARFDEARAPASQLTLGGRPVNLAGLRGRQTPAHTDPADEPAATVGEPVTAHADPFTDSAAASQPALSGGAVDPAAGSAAPSQFTLGGGTADLAGGSSAPSQFTQGGGTADLAGGSSTPFQFTQGGGTADLAGGSPALDADPFDVLSSRYTLDDTAWGMADLNSDPAAMHADPSAGPGPAAGAGGKATLLERLAWRLLTQGSWTVDRRQFLSGSSFDLPLSALKGETDDEQAAVPAGMGHWSLWGRGALTRFAGRERGLSLDGDVLTGLLGLDYSRGRWLAGVGLAYNDGAGAYRAPDSGAVGKLDSTLVSVHPYLHYALTDRLSAWGTLGYGAGGLSLRPGRAGTVGDGLKSVPGESGESDPIKTGIRMRMGALGLRGTVFANAATEVALKTDLMWVRTTSAATAGLAPVDGADASRVRLLLTGRHRHVLATGAELTPNVELGLRYDDGDAETGAGVELGGGLQYADPVLGLSVEATARALLAHEAGGYEEWGLSGSLQLDPGRLGRGLSLRLASGWGLTDSSTETLWQQQTASGLARGPGQTPQGRFLAEWAYGLDVPWTHGLLDPLRRC